MQPASLGQMVAFFTSVQGRASRSEYALGLAFLFFLNAAVINFAFGQAAGELEVGTAFLLTLPFLPSQFIIAARRCHDIGLPGAFVLLILVPMFGLFWLIALAFIPGNRDRNRYGTPPTYDPE